MKWNLLNWVEFFWKVWHGICVIDPKIISPEESWKVFVLSHEKCLSALKVFVSFLFQYSQHSGAITC